MATKKPQGPRVEFSQEVFDAICRRIAAGGDDSSLRKICASKDMPDRATFNDWRKRTPELQAQYDLACLDRQDTFFEEMIDIADTETDAAKARNRIEARKWAWARMNRKKFGDSMTLAGDPDAPVQLVLSGSDING